MEERCLCGGNVVYTETHTAAELIVLVPGLPAVGVWVPLLHECTPRAEGTTLPVQLPRVFHESRLLQSCPGLGYILLRGAKLRGMFASGETFRSHR